MTRSIGTVPLDLTALQVMPQTQFLVPLAMIEAPAGRIGIGAGDGKLLFQLYGPQPMLLTADIADLARAVATRAREAANYAWVMQP
jgi:hypothetical protein